MVVARRLAGNHDAPAAIERIGANAMANIFISYTAADRDWAFWIAKELEALGHIPHVHEWEIERGGDIYAWMEQRHDTADHVLCVVSDDYLKAPYSTLERNAALWQAASNRPGFVLFIAVKPCRLPTLSDHIRRCELYGVPEDAARLRFREFMAKREAPAAAAFPGTVFAVSNIPIRVPEHFRGRDDALTAIDTALARNKGRVAVTAVHGLRGVGKTTLAAAYAERHRSDYRATWWIRAQTSDGMRADLVALGVRLNWVVPDEKEEPALKTVMERLVHEGEGILLIYDSAADANALKPHLPRGGAARVLVTSNAPAWRGVAVPVEIRQWPKETGAEYLIARTGRTAECAAALALSEALGGLPLAHEQAAAYCERLDLPLAEYAKRFTAAPAKFLDNSRHAPPEYHDGLTVAKTFALAIDEAAKLHPAAEPLIVHAALLAPEPIPLFLFSQGREKFSEPLASTLEGDGFDEAVAALRTFALIDRETIADERDPTIITDCIRLHRLVRQVTAARCEGEVRVRAQRVLAEALVAVYPAYIWRDPNTWPLSRRLDPLALDLVGDDATVPKGVEQRTADLLSFAGQYRHALGAYAEARPLYERALAIYEKVLGAEHPDTAFCLNTLASLLQAQGDLAAARPLHERALAIFEEVLGAEHPETANNLNNLAALLQAQGDLAAARPLHERALAIFEEVLGAEEPATAMSLSNLGRLFRDLGQPDKAEPLFLRAIAVADKAFGAEHPQTGRYQSHYARLLLMTDRTTEALQLARAALAVHERVNGPNHPWTKDSAGVTADALAALGRAEETKVLRKKYEIENRAV